MKEKDINRVQIPFSMEVKLQNKILAALVLPIGLILLVLFVISFDSSFFLKNILAFFFVLVVAGSFIGFFCIWPFLAITKTVCTEEGIEFSVLSVTYSRISWSDIKKVETQTIDFSAVKAINPLMRFGTPPVEFTSINIFHKHSFLGFASAVPIKNYRKEDLDIFRTLLHQFVGDRISIV